MKHRIRAAYGVSKDSFSQHPEELWSGVGQGSAAAGPMWIAQEAVMLSYYDKITRGVEFTSPDKKQYRNIQTIGYIDDNNLLLNFDACTDPKDIGESSSTSLQEWANILSVTGGQLSGSKCKYHAYKWKNTPNGLKCKDIRCQIKYTDTNKNTITLKQEKQNQPVKYLGMHNSPNEDTTKQYEVCMLASREFGKCINKSNLTSHAEYTAYNAIWRAKLRYTLSPTNG